MRPNRPAVERDGTGCGSVTVTFLIPKQFPIGIDIGNFWGSVSVTVTLLIPKQFPIGIGIGNFLEINSKTISCRQVTFSVGTVIPQKLFYVIAPGAITRFSCRAPENNSKNIFLPVIILTQRVVEMTSFLNTPSSAPKAAGSKLDRMNSEKARASLAHQPNKDADD